MTTQTLAIFVPTHRFDSLETYYKDDIEVIDRDDEYVLAQYTIDSDKYDHTAQYFVGQPVNNYSDMWNLWIDRSGVAYFVPWWSHSLTAMLLWGKTVDELESEGWIHISGSDISNWRTPKVTDRQYDTLALYCEHNRRRMFSQIA